MSTLLTPRPSVRDRFAVAASRQERLFGDADREPRPARAVVHEPVAEPAPAAPAVAPTLDAAITERWERLAAGAPAACPVCDTPMEPRRSGASGVVVGRCRACGSALA